MIGGMILINYLCILSHASLSRLLAVKKTTQKMSREMVFSVFTTFRAMVCKHAPQTGSASTTGNANSQAPSQTYGVRKIRGLSPAICV